MKTKNILSKKKVIPLIAILVISMLGGVVILAKQNKVDEKQKIFDKKVQEWIDYCRSQPEICFSSYNASSIETEQFKEIENLGIEYLPYMLKYIEENQGFNSSALIVAVQKNAKTYIKNYSSPIEWRDGWNEYTKALPEKVQSIKEEIYKDNSKENVKMKKDELVKFGVLAIPLILEDVKAGNEEMADVVRTIVASDKMVQDESILSDKDKAKNKTWSDKTVPKDNDVSKWKTWIDANEGKYNKIKEQVLKIK